MNVSTVLAAIAIAAAVYLAHYATLGIHSGFKGFIVDLPMPTQVVLDLCRYHVFTVLALLAIGGLFVSDKYLKDERSRRIAQIGVLSGMLVVVSAWFLALSLPSRCMCDAWKSWDKTAHDLH